VLNDQEVLLRHLHKETAAWIDEYRTHQRGGGVKHDGPLCCQPNSPTSSPSPSGCLPTEPERYAKRLASSMTQMKAFYDAITRGAEEALSYCDSSPSTSCRTTVLNLMHLL